MTDEEIKQNTEKEFEKWLKNSMPEEDKIKFNKHDIRLFKLCFMSGMTVGLLTAEKVKTGNF